MTATYQLLLALITALAASLMAGCSSTVLNITSPSGRNRIEISKHRSVLIETKFSFALSSENETITDNGWLATYDAPDAVYFRQFPENAWISDSVFRAQDFSSKPESYTDSVSVTNHSDRTLKFLVINCVDRLILVKLGSGEGVELPAPRGNGVLWVEAHGMMSDGVSVQAGENFNTATSFKQHLRYCIDIHNDGLRITNGIIGDSRSLCH